MLHLRPRARAMLHDGSLVTGDADTATVARLLLDRGLADPEFDSVPADDAVGDVTVVVPVRDRPRQLARLLAALPPGLPVVVVDDGSEEPRTIRAVAVELGATVLRHQVSRGPAAARNTGLGRVRTDLVAFLDSDVVPEPGWLGLLRRHLDDPAVGIVGPRVLGSVPRDDDGWLCRYEAARSSLDLGPRPGTGPAAVPGGLPARAPRCSCAGRPSAPPPSTRPCRWPRTSTWSGGCTRPAGGCATSPRPSYATTTGPRSGRGCGARRSTAPEPRCWPTGTAPTWRRWC